MIAALQKKEVQISEKLVYLSVTLQTLLYFICAIELIIRLAGLHYAYLLNSGYRSGNQYILASKMPAPVQTFHYLSALQILPGQASLICT
jgi:hypothetical protein